MLGHKTRGEGRKPKPKRASLHNSNTSCQTFIAQSAPWVRANLQIVAVRIDKRRMITAGQNQNGTASLHNLSHNSNTFY